MKTRKTIDRTAITHIAGLISRNRPVTMDAVLQSGAVSDSYRERVAELLDQYRGNPGRLLQALMDGEASGFRAAKKDQLQKYLELEGYLDAEEPLDSEAIVRQMQAAVALQIESGDLGPAQARQLTLKLLAYLEAAS